VHGTRPPRPLLLCRARTGLRAGSPPQRLGPGRVSRARMTDVSATCPQGAAGQPAYCYDKWCYVDPATCGLNKRACDAAGARPGCKRCCMCTVRSAQALTAWLSTGGVRGGYVDPACRPRSFFPTAVLAPEELYFRCASLQWQRLSGERRARCPWCPVRDAIVRADCACSRNSATRPAANWTCSVRTRSQKKLLGDRLPLWCHLVHSFRGLLRRS
jgi:hypothetical protein